MSYDPVAVLAAFAAKRGITYDLLSDEGSRAIRELGLLNTHLDEQHAHYGAQTREHQQGVPYPGVFILDEHGGVVDKWFEQGYRVRPTAVSLLETVVGGEAVPRGVEARAETDQVQATAWLGSATYRPYQKLRLGFAVGIRSGLHVYGSPTPEGLTPLTVTVDPLEALEVGPAELPTPRSLQVAGLDETLFVYEGQVRGWLPLTLFKNLGDVAVTARLRYQACADTDCYPPREVTVKLWLTGVDLIRD